MSDLESGLNNPVGKAFMSVPYLILPPQELFAFTLFPGVLVAWTLGVFSWPHKARGA